MGLLTSLFTMAIIMGAVFYLLSNGASNRALKIFLAVIAYILFGIAFLCLLLETALVIWVTALVT